MPAKLSLVGAGPGDPELISLKAIKVLESADVILYDALVNPKIFDLFKSKAELIFVGKRKGKPSISQEQINELILNKLKQGQDVVRLKGGNPQVLARGIEEIELAQHYGFEYQVIPGLTSGLAIPSARAITLTRREQSDSVTLVTGHQINEKKLKLWTEIILSGGTLVVYMGLSNIVEIIAGFKQKIEPNLTAITIHNGSLEDEKLIISNLSNLAQDLIDNEIKPPALLIFGKHINTELVLEQIRVETPLLELG